MILQNRTKIVATIGPSSSDRNVLEAMIDAGMDVARFNFSHGHYDEFKKWLGTLRDISVQKEQSIAILQDLQGPRIRIGGDVPAKGVSLEKGEEVEVGYGKYKKNFIPIDYKKLVKEVKKGTRILLVDGLVELVVTGIVGSKARAKVVSGGMIFPKKGVNIPNADLSIESLSEKDREDLAWGVDNDVDYIGLSFVRSADDIKKLRALILKRNKDSKIKIIAKIEKPQAVKNIKSILREADGVMVARGDLGIELPPERVPTAQKEIILAAIKEGKPVITATQMMESMMENIRPTRAEVSDVANAILDGTDAIMLSGETAMGKYPVEVVDMMTDIATEVEKGLFKTGRLHFENISKEELENIRSGKDHVTSARAVGGSVSDLAIQSKAKYIVVATLTGHSAQMVSRCRPKTPIIGISPETKTVDQMSLLWGVRSFSVPMFFDTEELVVEVSEFVKNKKLVKKGDIVAIVCSHPIGKTGDTNLIKIHKIV